MFTVAEVPLFFTSQYFLDFRLTLLYIYNMLNSFSKGLYRRPAPITTDSDEDLDLETKIAKKINKKYGQ